MKTDKEKVDIKSNMIAKSIILLRSEGLKFSVDSLANAMKISKKTVYKYFANKEELAMAIFKYAFTAYNAEFDNIDICNLNKITVKRLLKIINDSLFYSQDWIYNRYSLNSSIRNFVDGEINKIWSRFENILHKQYGNLISEKCFQYVVFSSLKEFKTQNNCEELYESFVNLIFKI